MPTDDTRAEAMFADWLLPLGYANRRRGIAYLERGPRRQSYWAPVISRTGGLERLSGAGCEPAAMLASLGDYWKRTNEPSLPKLLPSLEELRQQLAGATPTKNPEEQGLTEFVYPLF